MVEALLSRAIQQNRKAKEVRADDEKVRLARWEPIANKKCPALGLVKMSSHNKSTLITWNQGLSLLAKSVRRGKLLSSL